MNYTSNDLSIIYDPYFKLICLSNRKCELQSLNTGHFWHIRFTQGVFMLFHKYHLHDSFHFQAVAPSIFDCLLTIADHDEFQQRGRKSSTHYPKNSFFDKIIDTYNVKI